MEIVHEGEQGFFFVLKRGDFISVRVCVCPYIHIHTHTRIINWKLFFGSNQFKAERTKFPYYRPGAIHCTLKKSLYFVVKDDPIIPG